METNLLDIHHLIQSVESIQHQIELPANSHLISYLYALRSILERKGSTVKRIAVAGSFSSGKSTLVNSMMKLKATDRQLTSMAECTAVPTVIRPADKAAIKKWDNGVLLDAPLAFADALSHLKVDSYNELGDIIKHYFQKEIEFIRIVKTEDALRSVEYLDLPGLLGIAGKLFDRGIYAGVFGSEGILYVINAEQGGISKSDEDFATSIQDASSPVLIVVTHLDLITGKKAVCASIKSSAKKLLGNRYSGIVTPKYSNENNEYNFKSSDYRIINAFMAKQDTDKILDCTLSKVIRLSKNIINTGSIPEAADRIHDTLNQISNACGTTRSALLFKEYDLVKTLIKTNLRTQTAYDRDHLELLARYVGENALVKAGIWKEMAEEDPAFIFIMYLCAKNKNIKTMYRLEEDYIYLIAADKAKSKQAYAEIAFSDDPDLTKNLKSFGYSRKIKSRLRVMAKAGCVDAQFLLGKPLKNPTCVKWLIGASENGCIEAMLLLGEYYVERDQLAKAKPFWEKAGELGEGKAYICLEKHYPEKRKEYLELASSAKNPAPEGLFEYAQVLWKDAETRSQSLHYFALAYQHEDTKTQVEKFITDNTTQGSGTHICTKVQKICLYGELLAIIPSYTRFDRYCRRTESRRRTMQYYDFFAPILIEEIERGSQALGVWCGFASKTLTLVLKLFSQGYYKLAFETYVNGVDELAKAHLNRDAYDGTILLYKGYI